MKYLLNYNNSNLIIIKIIIHSLLYTYMYENNNDFSDVKYAFNYRNLKWNKHTQLFTYSMYCKKYA